MSTQYLQDFVNKTRQYKTSLFCLAASCCYLLSGQPQGVNAAARNDNAPKRRSPEEIKQLLLDVSEKMKSCDSKSMLDRLTDKRNALEHELFTQARVSMLLTGTDSCPGTNIPAGTSFSDTGTTIGSTSTVTTVNTGCVLGQEAPNVYYTDVKGPDHVYKFVLPAVGSRVNPCTITVTPSSGYDTSIYYLSIGNGGCPNGTGNTVTNCIKGSDAVFANITEDISDVQTDATPAGTYFLFIDSFYLTAPKTAGPYTLNFNCTTLSPTAAVVGVGGRVTTADGRGISNAKVSVVLPSGESRFVTTSPFGFYHFDGLEVGQAYVFQASHKQYEFPNGAQLITVNDTLENVDFVAGSGRPAASPKH